MRDIAANKKTEADRIIPIYSIEKLTHDSDISKDGKKTETKLPVIIKSPDYQGKSFWVDPQEPARLKAVGEQNALVLFEETSSFLHPELTKEEIEHVAKAALEHEKAHAQSAGEYGFSNSPQIAKDKVFYQILLVRVDNTISAHFEHHPGDDTTGLSQFLKSSPNPKELSDFKNKEEYDEWNQYFLLLIYSALRDMDICLAPASPSQPDIAKAASLYEAVKKLTTGGYISMEQNLNPSITIEHHEYFGFETAPALIKRAVDVIKTDPDDAKACLNAFRAIGGGELFKIRPKGAIPDEKTLKAKRAIFTNFNDFQKSFHWIRQVKDPNIQTLIASYICNTISEVVGKSDWNNRPEFTSHLSPEDKAQQINSHIEFSARILRGKIAFERIINSQFLRSFDQKQWTSVVISLQDDICDATEEVYKNLDISARKRQELNPSG